MAPTYKLCPDIELEFVGDRFSIVNTRTGFSGLGNRHAFEVLSQLYEPKSEEDVVRTVLPKYPSSQGDRVALKVPNILRWAVERGIIEMTQ